MQINHYHVPRRSQDFCLGGHPADVTRYLLRDLQEPTTFGEGGVVAEIFHRDLHKRSTFAGGGGGG